MTAADDLMERPNKAHFEKEIASINEKIHELQNDYTELAGQTDQNLNDVSEKPAEISLLRANITCLKRDREIARSQLRQIAEKLNELQQKIKVQKEDAAKLESDDLYYKDERKLAAYLARLEKQFASMQTKNVREEKAIVTQINKAKRNQKQLTKWRKLIADKDEMVKTLNELKLLRDVLYKTIGDIKYQEAESRKSERTCRAKIKVLAAELDTLYRRKQLLVVDYENERRQYASLARHKVENTNYHQSISDSVSYGPDSQCFIPGQSKSVKRTSSYKQQVVKTNSNESRDEFDNGEYELFYTEKQLCHNLLAYVQNFSFDNNGECSTAESALTELSFTKQESNVLAQPAKTPESDDDDVKHSFVVSAPSKTLKKKHSTRRDKRRVTQSIPHAPHVFDDFERLGLKAPVNYSELPVVVEKLKNKLKYFEDQTLLPLNFSFSFDTCSYATSESELTVDTDSYMFSVLSLSELDDLSASYSQRNNCSQGSLSFDAKDNVIINDNNAACAPDDGDEHERSVYSTIRKKPSDKFVENLFGREVTKPPTKICSQDNLVGRKSNFYFTSLKTRWASLESFLAGFSNTKHKNWAKDEGFCSKGSTR